MFIMKPFELSDLRIFAHNLVGIISICVPVGLKIPNSQNISFLFFNPKQF